MKWLLPVTVITFGLVSLLFAGNQYATNDPERLFIPFLDPASQSNVTVTVSAIFAKEVPCPPEYTNSLSNTNLFTTEEQMWIKDASVKFKNVRTNSGPPGTILVDFYKTNFVSPPLYWVKTNANWMAHRTNELWVAHFQYTNSGALEEINFGNFGKSVVAKFTNKSNDGYFASIAWVGSGSLLTFTERKHDSGSGVLVRIADLHSQGTDWDYRQADFSAGHLVEYMQMTNGMLLGKWLMWNGSTGDLSLEAESKTPYDWNNHRIQLSQ